MLSDPKATLAYHNSRALTTKRNFSKIACSHVASAMTAAISKGKIKPEPVAIRFYGLNHCVAMIQGSYEPLEPLPPSHVKLLDHYHAFANHAAVRAFHYLVAICIRESRHAHPSTFHANKQTILGKFVNANALIDFQTKTLGTGEQAGVDYFQNNPPACSIGTFCDFLEWQFTNLGYSGAFGGKPWAAIAATAARFVRGETTAEIMLDTLWTLAHNTGPIFNKGMLFEHHDGDLLQRVLDVQRAGMIPTAIENDIAAHQHAAPSHIYGRITSIAAVEMITGFLEENYPDVIAPYVDWFVVESLGAIGSYGPDKIKQVAKHGPSLKANAAMQAKAKAMALALAAQDEADTEFQKTNFEVMPGVSVKKHKREHA